MPKKKNIINATLLVTGCCLGAGMLGLPVKSALAGFLPASVAMLFCYLLTTFMGLFLLEATLWFENRVNLPSIAEFTLGKPGKYIAMGLFLFLFYCLFVAYLDGGGIIFSTLLAAIFHYPISHANGLLLCMLLVASIIYMGSHLVVFLNRILLLGLVFSYLALVIFGLSHIQTQNLLHHDLISTFHTIPILLICFGFQNIVPSLTYYLDKNINAIRLAIMIGNFIPFLIYLIWNMVILGMLPEQHLELIKQANLVTSLLNQATHSIYLIYFINAFTMFAMLISFIPNAMSFMDFLNDGLAKLFHRTRIANHFFLLCCVFLPPTVFALYNPGIFLRALGFAGGFIDVLLFGILPASIVLVGRKKVVSEYRVIGGSVTPLCMIVICVVILFIKNH